MIHHENRDTPTTIADLPTEVLEQIFYHVFPPWHLRYTQEHDRLETTNTYDLLLTGAELFNLQTAPLFAKLPSCAPLLVCHRFYNIGSPIFASSFTGQTHLVSYVKWNTIHTSYSGIMARTKMLIMDIGYLWSFNKLNLSDKFPLLEKLLISDHVVKHELDVEVLNVQDVDENDEGPFLEVGEDVRQMIGCGGDRVIARSACSVSLYDIATIISNYTAIQHENLVFRT